VHRICMPCGPVSAVHGYMRERGGEGERERERERGREGERGGERGREREREREIVQAKED
jgi:hypothetical protein